MPSLSEFIEIYRRFPEQMAQTLAQDALQVASDLNAQVTLRRIERGENADGGSFSPYSLPYERYRQRRGRQTAFKSYEFEGLLNASIHPEIKSQKVGEVVVSIAARGQLSEDKLRGAFRVEKKHGASDAAANILTPSEEETNNAEIAFAERRARRAQQLLA